MPVPLTFFLKSLLVSLVPFEAVFCCRPEQLQPGEGAAGLPSWAAAGRNGAEHAAAPGSTKAPDTHLLLLQSPQKIQPWFAMVWDPFLFTLLALQHLPNAS